QQPAEPENYAALVLAENFDRAEQVQDDNRDYDGRQIDHGSASGSTVSLSLSMWTTRTRCPGWRGLGDTASQYSPRTNTLPSGMSGVIAEPVKPIMPSLPVSTLLRRARTASETRNVVIAANGSASAIAVAQRMRISGTGLSMSITAPNTIATAPPAPSTPCDVNLASSANSTNASIISAAPSQLMGRIEIADNPS